MIFKLFMTCPRGFEIICMDEILSLGGTNCKIDLGGVHFSSNLEGLYLINYSSRLGMNLLLEINSFEINTIDSLYEQINNLPWEEYLTIINSFSIQVKIRNSQNINNSHFAKLRIKDAIVDYFSDKYGERPNVKIKDPDIPINVYINNSSVKVYLNSSGNPLFKRNYRTKVHKASLNEVYAAGLLQLSQWDKQSPLVDPMCGSGTFVIEAAMMLNNIPSGFFRKYFAFMKWQNFDPTLFAKVIDKCKAAIVKNNSVKILANDISETSISLCRETIKRFGELINIEITNRNFRFMNIINSHIISNPPYGKRIGRNINIEQLYERIETKFLNNNNKLFLLIEDNDYVNAFEGTINNPQTIMNGDIKCLFIQLNKV